MLSLLKGTLKRLNIIQCSKCNDRTSTEADSRVTYASQGSILRVANFKGGTGVRLVFPNSWRRKAGRNGQREDSGSNYDCGIKVGNWEMN